MSEGTKLHFIDVNPKRNGTDSYNRYEQYKKAKTVGEFYSLHPNKKKAAAKNDLNWDMCHAYCTVVEL